MLESVTGFHGDDHRVLGATHDADLKGAKSSFS